MGVGVGGVQWWQQAHVLHTYVLHVCRVAARAVHIHPTRKQTNAWDTPPPSSFAHTTPTHMGHARQAHARTHAQHTPYPPRHQVAGNFHLAPGRSFQQGSQHVHDLSPFVDHTFDLTHTVHGLSFGQPYPGMRNPLDGAQKAMRGYDNPLGQHGMYQYFLKVRGMGGLGNQAPAHPLDTTTASGSTARHHHVPQRWGVTCESTRIRRREHAGIFETRAHATRITGSAGHVHRPLRT